MPDSLSYEQETFWHLIKSIFQINSKPHPQMPLFSYALDSPDFSSICAPFPYSSKWKTLSFCSLVGWLREIRQNPNAWWRELCFLEHIAKTAAGLGSPGDNTLLAAVGNSGNSGERSTSGWIPTWVLPEAGDFTGRLTWKWWGWGRMGKMSFEPIFRYYWDGNNLLTQYGKAASLLITLLCNAGFPCDVLGFFCVGVNDCPLPTFIGF